MPVIVTCRCGKRFAAKDHLYGQEVACPACGGPLIIGHQAGAPAEGVYVSCACGRAFLAPESMRGEQARCRGCGRMLLVPGHDPLGLTPRSPPPGAAPYDPLALSLPAAEEEGEIPWKTLKLMGMIGGGILLALILITTVVNNWHRRPKVEHLAKVIADAKQAITPPAPATEERPPQEDPFGPAAAPVPESNDSSPLVAGSSVKSIVPKSAMPEADPFDGGTAPQAIVTNKPEPPVSSAIARLPRGVEDWYAQPGARLTGIRRVNPTDPPIAHFSWMTGLLPFLGHGALYQRFDFNQPLTKGKNLQLGATLVPEFLNPLDDRQRWKGYPFDGIALTHFVGVSGVEDARNVVAAKLPRSDPRAGVFGYDEIARSDEITDGTSQTVMVAGAGALANPWIFGGGATIRGAREPLFDQTSGLGTRGLMGGGSIVVMADGSVRHVSASVDPRVFKAMCTIHGADSVDLERASAPFALEDFKPPRPSGD